ncbi:hypothetical protein DP200_11675 [Enterobacter hormaechei subsp. oharae]|nr:hypothetical protein [Enterobacter hormaechei]RAY42721.1 hypothetical protein DP193_19675 [Enterobacter hormaechei subsp. oharae]RAY62423.1 hypothetical protein DP200_11675 [Enterobacter hormaechei subsp. oharae]TXV34371.1 hypothetical protein D4M74_10835 [Enterobacter hormaechei]TXV88296.1 hypothetical protein D4M68_10900 [Enterobacter hormaechei]
MNIVYSPDTCRCVAMFSA